MLNEVMFSWEKGGEVCTDVSPPSGKKSIFSLEREDICTQASYTGAWVTLRAKTLVEAKPQRQTSESPPDF